MDPKITIEPIPKKVTPTKKKDQVGNSISYFSFNNEITLLNKGSVNTRTEASTISNHCGANFRPSIEIKMLSLMNNINKVGSNMYIDQKNIEMVIKKINK